MSAATLPPRRGIVSRVFHGTGVGVRQLDMFVIIEILCLILLIIAIMSQKTARKEAAAAAARAALAQTSRPVSAPAPAPMAQLAPAPAPSVPAPSAPRPPTATAPSPDVNGNRAAVSAPAALPKQADQAGRPANVNISGVWKGSYQCAQGVTALVLTVSGPNRALDARFRFETRDGVTGEFLMTGAYSDADRALVLRPSGWISRPRGFDGVPIVAKFDPQAGELVGRIDYPGCVWVRLARAA